MLQRSAISWCELTFVPLKLTYPDSLNPSRTVLSDRTGDNSSGRPISVRPPIVPGTCSFSASAIVLSIPSCCFSSLPCAFSVSSFISSGVKLIKVCVGSCKMLASSTLNSPLFPVADLIWVGEVAIIVLPCPIP